MRQLNAAEYDLTNEIMGEIDGKGLSVYERVKETVATGDCIADSLGCAHICTKLSRPICEVLVEITNAQQADEDTLAYELARSEAGPAERERLPYFVQ